MSHIPVVVGTDTVTFYVNHKPYAIDKSFPTYEDVLEELRKADPDTDRLIALTKPAEAVKAQVEAAESAVEGSADYLPKGVVSVTNSEIRYNGEVIHGVLVDRILASLAEGFNIMPQIRFIENLYQNPNEWSRDELYLWLENNNLPITEDGHFLAYKKVNKNFTSVHDGRTKNDPGTVVSMPREAVDTVRAHTCSTGLHFCSKSYLPSFGGSTIVMLKINPADVVSIPSDYNNAKGRAWQYLVLDVLDEDPQSKQWASVVSATGGTFRPPVAAGRVDAPAPAGPARLVIGSDLAKALFAACNEIGLTEREDRLDWADGVLDDNDLSSEEGSLESFNDLTVAQAEVLLEVAKRAADEKNAALDAKVSKAKQAQIDAINEMGIIKLRSEASKAGLAGAWKGHRADALRNFLIGKIK